MSHLYKIVKNVPDSAWWDRDLANAYDSIKALANRWPDAEFTMIRQRDNVELVLFVGKIRKLFFEYMENDERDYLLSDKEYIKDATNDAWRQTLSSTVSVTKVVEFIDFVLQDAKRESSIIDSARSKQRNSVVLSELKYAAISAADEVLDYVKDARFFGAKHVPHPNELNNSWSVFWSENRSSTDNLNNIYSIDVGYVTFKDGDGDEKQNDLSLETALRRVMNYRLRYKYVSILKHRDRVITFNDCKLSYWHQNLLTTAENNVIKEFVENCND